MRNVLALPIAIAFASVTGLALADHFPPKGSAAPPAVKSAGPSTTLPQGNADRSNAVRDWAKIDTNKDHSISPEEMEAYLLANRGSSKGK